MGVTLNAITAITDTSTTLLQGVSDLEIVTVGGQRYLCVASEANSAITIYDLSDPQAPVWVGETPYSSTSGTSALGELVSFDAGGETQLLTLGRYDNKFGLYSLDATGTLTFEAALSDGMGSFNRGLVGEVVTVGGNSYALSVSQGRPGFQTHTITNDGMLIPLEQIADSGTRSLGDVSAIASHVRGGKTYVFTASAFDAGIHSFRMAADGSLVERDQVLPGEFDGFSGITNLAAVDVGGRSFLIATAAGTNSIAVYRISGGGMLKQVDFLMDTLGTRFGEAQGLEIIEDNGRVFVLAGGGDDGITVFELTERGQLVVVSVLADDFNTTLNNISSIEAVEVDGTWMIYVGSSSEHGFTVLELDLSGLGQEIKGGRGNDILTGGAGDDVIWGKGHSDQLFGGDGDDRLIDGRGRDQMTGGAGADTFEFVPDRRPDTVTDYELGIDVIDLSQYRGIYHISSLNIVATPTGATITVKGDVIHLTNPEGGPFDVSLFAQDDFIFG